MYVTGELPSQDSGDIIFTMFLFYSELFAAQDWTALLLQLKEKLHVQSCWAASPQLVNKNSQDLKKIIIHLLHENLL